MPAVNRKAAKTTVKSGKGSRNDSIDIYVRMNEDQDKDYCFNVPTNKPVSWLMKVFDTIPIILSPSYFFYEKPQGFAVSVHPGYLTAEGALLFTDKSHRDEWLKPISDDALIGDVIYEGQLVVPIWRPNHRRQYLTLAVLAAWLYLDLPEFISPTPGTAPSNLLYWMLQELLIAPEAPSQEASIFSNEWFQLIFFAFHIFKVCAIYLILWNGVWHPKSLNPYKRKAAIKIPKPEQLSELGWTGARRMSPETWATKYQDHRVNRAGGVVEAYHKGLLTLPKGYVLAKGEGWNVLAHRSLDDVEIEDDMLDTDGKFVVSKQYFLELAKPLSQKISESRSPTDDLEMIKNFRSYGYMDGPVILQELFTDLIPMHTEKK